MLDHLYIVDATDFEMPTIKAKMDQAIEVADKAIQANPDLPDGWVMKALALSWAFRNQEALPFIQRAREINAQNPGAMAIQAEIYTELRRYNEALQLVADAIEIAQASKPINRAALGRANYVKGNILQILGKTDDAIAAYESAWQISSTPFNPSDPWAVVPPGYILYQLGPIYLFQGKSKLAFQRYTDALEIDKQDPFLYYLRGRVYRFLGQPDKANAEFQLCLKLDSLQFRCSRNLGQVAYAQQDWRTTIRCMKPIIDDNSQISDDYYYLAAAYVNSNLCEKAVTLLIRGFSLLKISTGQPLWKQADFFTLSQNCGVQLATP